MNGYQEKRDSAVQGFVAGGAGRALDIQPEVMPSDSLQAQSAENAERIRMVNRQLAMIGDQLFSECEVTKDSSAKSPAPSMPSLQGSLYQSAEGLTESLNRLSSILSRL